MKKKLFNFPFIIIILVWFVFSSQFFLFGKVPFPSSYQVDFFSPWSAYGQLRGPVKNNATPDVITQIYPWKHLVIDIVKIGQIPFWNPYSFSGTPLLANYQSSVLSPINILYFIFSFTNAWSLIILLQPLIAGLFMYFYSKALRMSSTASLITAVSFMFCGFITTWMMYGTLPFAILFLPLSLFAVEKFLDTRKSIYAVLLTVSIPLSFFSGHFQTSIYFLGFILSYILFKLITKKDNASFFQLLIFVVLGLLMSMPQILPSVEFYGQSIRSSLFLKSEVIPWGYISTFVAPDFFGNPVTRNDWFGHYAEWNGYMGLLAVMLGCYVIFRKKSSYVLFFIIFSLITLALAFQTPLLDLLIALKIPVISTSAVSRIIVLFSFSFVVLSGFGFDALRKDISDKKIKPVLLWLATFAFVFGFLWVVIFAKLFLPVDKLSIAKSNLIFPTFLFIASGVVIVLSLLFSKKKSTIFIFGALVVSLVSFDMLRFVTKWQPFDAKELVFKQVPVSKFFSGISGYDRAFGNYGAETSVFYKLPSVEGYDSLYPARYGEFITAVSDGKIGQPNRSGVNLPKKGKYLFETVNLLGIKYIVHKVSDGHAVWAFPFWELPQTQFKMIFDDHVYQLYENKKSYPRAFIADAVVVKDSKQKIIDTMFSKNIDLRKTVVLEEKPEVVFGKGGGTAEIVSYTPNEVRIKTVTAAPEMLFLSDNYYPGWKVSVDGKFSKIYRADYTFRGVVVPEGTHTVQFNYVPGQFRLGILAAAFGLLGTIGFGFYYNTKRK